MMTVKFINLNLSEFYHHQVIFTFILVISTGQIKFVDLQLITKMLLKNLFNNNLILWICQIVKFISKILILLRKLTMSIIDFYMILLVILILNHTYKMTSIMNKFLNYLISYKFGKRSMYYVICKLKI